MQETKTLLCLASSFKPPSGRCIAGREIVGNELGRWLRPVSARETREIAVVECAYKTGALPEVLDVIDIPMLRHEPRGHQIENYVIGAGRWVKRGSIRAASVIQYLDTPATLWPNTESSSAGVNDRVDPDDLATVHGSLFLIQPDELRINVSVSPWDNKKKFRAAFTYRETHYNFSATDPKIRNAFAAKEEGDYAVERSILCVSLTEPYERDHKCYKLVASIITEQPLA